MLGEFSSLKPVLKFNFTRCSKFVILIQPPGCIKLFFIYFVLINIAVVITLSFSFGGPSLLTNSD